MTTDPLAELAAVTDRLQQATHRDHLIRLLHDTACDPGCRDEDITMGTYIRQADAVIAAGWRYDPCEPCDDCGEHIGHNGGHHAFWCGPFGAPDGTAPDHE